MANNNNNHTTGRLWIGTSNIAIPGAKDSFPEAYRHSSRLTYHAALFNSLEVNSTFYKIPMAKTLARWTLEVPEDFRFTLKLHKSITHQPQLAFSPADIEQFMAVAAALDNKKGSLLIQFPGSIQFGLRKEVERILKTLEKADPGQLWPKAVEFRHTSWYNQQTEAMLGRYNASLVLHDIPRSQIIEPIDNSPFVYWRFHGMAGDYKGGYDVNYLKDCANRILNWMKEGKDVYVYFNNTIGDAFDNALTVQELVYNQSHPLI